MQEMRKKLLERAQEILSDPDRWTTGSFARDKDDNPVDITDAGAVKFCLHGSLDKAFDEVCQKHEFTDYHRLSMDMYHIMLDSDEYDYACMATLNDEGGYSETMNFIKDILAKEE